MAKDEYSIRSIKRGLRVLQAINRSGSMRLMDIKNATGLPYPTVCRIVETLVDAGMIEAETTRRHFRPTALVQSLSVGFQEENALVLRARPYIVDLCKQLKWPITVTTRVGNAMMVRDSTHKLTTLTFHNYAPGYTLPLLECSVGKAYLAYCDKEERENIITSLQQLEAAEDRMAQLLLSSDDFLKQVRQDGYATHAYNQYTEHPGKTSSLGVPILSDGKLVGALGLIFFSSAMPLAKAAREYVAEMQRTAAAIGASIDAIVDAS